MRRAQALFSGCVVASCLSGAGCRPEPREAGEVPSLDPGSRVEAQLDCRARTPAGALALVPDQAEWIVHVSPAALVRAGAWSLAAADFERDGDYVEAVGLFADCGVELGAIEHVRVGFDADGERVIVVSGAGIGEPERGACLVRAVQDLVEDGAGEGGALVVTPWPTVAGAATVELDEGRVYLLGDVLATPAPAGERSSIAWRSATGPRPRAG